MYRNEQYHTQVFTSGLNMCLHFTNYIKAFGLQYKWSHWCLKQSDRGGARGRQMVKQCSKCTLQQNSSKTPKSCLY